MGSSSFFSFFFFFWRYAIFACKSGLLPYQFHSIKLYRCDRERMNFCMGDTYICIELNERPVEPGHILYRFVFMASNMTIHCLQKQHLTFEVYLQNYFWFFFWKQPVWVILTEYYFRRVRFIIERDSDRKLINDFIGFWRVQPSFM